MDIKFIRQENNRFFFEIDKGRLNYVNVNYHNITEGFEFILSTQKDGLNKKLTENNFYLDVIGKGDFEIDLGINLFSKHKFIKKFSLYL